MDEDKNLKLQIMGSFFEDLKKLREDNDKLDIND